MLTQTIYQNATRPSTTFYYARTALPSGHSQVQIGGTQPTIPPFDRADITGNAGSHRPWQLKCCGHLLQHGTPTDQCRRAVETLCQCPGVDALDPKSRACARCRRAGSGGARTSGTVLARVRSAPVAAVQTSGTVFPKMVYRGGCVAENAECWERSPSTYDEQIGVTWPQGARKER